MTGRAHTRGTHSRSHAASSSGISQASRLSSVQRTCSKGNPARSQSARRYGVYDVEMMNAGMRALTASSVLSASGTSSTCSALNDSTSSSVT